jgi:hypothetical protein
MDHGATLGARSDVHHARSGVVTAYTLEDIHGPLAVDVDIKIGIPQGIGVGRVAYAIKDDVLLRNNGIEQIEVADIVDDYAHTIFEAVDVSGIATTVVHQGIEHGNLGPKFDTAQCQVAADKPESAQHQDAFAGKKRI